MPQSAIFQLYDQVISRNVDHFAAVNFHLPGWSACGCSRLCFHLGCGYRGENTGGARHEQCGHKHVFRLRWLHFNFSLRLISPAVVLDGSMIPSIFKAAAWTMKRCGALPTK